MKSTIRTVAVFLCLVLLLVSAGCRVEFGADEHPTASGMSGTDESVRGSLSIYLLKAYPLPENTSGDTLPEDYYSYSEYYNLSGYIEAYRQVRPNVTVTVTEFERPEEYMRKLSEDLRKKSGPDVIFFTHNCFDDNYRELSEEGFLADLGDLIGQDPGGNLSLEDFPEALRKLYDQDGKQTALPLDMFINFWITTAEVLQSSGLTLPQDGSEILRFFDTFAGTLPAADSASLPFVEYLYYDSGLSELFCWIMYQNGADWWDASAKTARFDTAEFRILLEEFRVLASRYPSYASSSFNIDYTDETSRWKENKLLCSSTRYPYPVLQKYNKLKDSCGQTPVLFYLTHNGGKTVLAHNYICRNENASSPETAWDFMKFALGGMVNKRVYQKNLDLWDENIQKSGSFDYSKNEWVRDDGIIDHFYQPLYTLHDGISNVIAFDAQVHMMVKQAVSEILQQDLTADEASARLQKNVLEYLKR